MGRYTADGIERGPAWYSPGYDDSSWLSGAAQLGYGEGDEATEVFRGGPTTGDRFLSPQLRHTFTVTSAGTVPGRTLALLRAAGPMLILNVQLRRPSWRKRVCRFMCTSLVALIF